MDTIERMERLVMIIKACGGEVLGKKKFQKLIYLAQEKGLYLGYDFGYHYFGVFSSEVESDLHLGETFGLLKQEVTNYCGNPVKICLTEKNHIDDNEYENVLSTVSKLSKEESRTLEVLSTILYLKNAGYTGEKLSSNLQRLKGHLKDFFERADKLAQEHYNLNYSI